VLLTYDGLPQVLPHYCGCSPTQIPRFDGVTSDLSPLCQPFCLFFFPISVHIGVQKPM
jgi:hypothetical protein